MRDFIIGRLYSALELTASAPRALRKLLVFSIDAMLCLAAVWIAFSLRLGEWPTNADALLFFGAASLVFWTVSAGIFGVYRSLTRFSGGGSFRQVFFAVSLLVLPLLITFSFVQVGGVPRTMAVIHPIVFLLLLIFFRLSIRYAVGDLLHASRGDVGSRRRLLIYGAGRGGQQLARSLRAEPHLVLAGFVDDDPVLKGQHINGAPVWHSSSLEDLLVEQEVSEILLAIPSAARSRKRAIMNSLQGRGVTVRTLPGVAQLVDGQVAISDLRPVEVEDLLGRDPVAPNELLMSKSLVGKVVMVTGAGGSIGSELCRQIVRSRPCKIVLVEQSEYSLYSIDGELRRIIKQEGLAVEVIPELADVADRHSVFRIFKRWLPETVYHAAAYKHVPLVEANPIAGMRNNIYSTMYCALAAEEVSVGHFILVSTDKAVRPTNIMGATKRVCELVLQARAQKQSNTLFTMVRFGNVLGSSGSVVPLFKAQIAAGGPVTVTHRDVTRYFMTIPEATQLVIQAGGMARGGEVFVLDMGQPVRIVDLAETMVRLSGLTVRSKACPDGDIEIAEVGLRPGEKLYEELLIGENPASTAHPCIMQARETMLEWPELSAQLERMGHALINGDASAALVVLRQLVPEYHQPEVPMAVAS